MPLTRKATDRSTARIAKKQQCQSPKLDTNEKKDRVLALTTTIKKNDRNHRRKAAEETTHGHQKIDQNDKGTGGTINITIIKEACKTMGSKTVEKR